MHGQHYIENYSLLPHPGHWVQQVLHIMTFNVMSPVQTSVNTIGRNVEECLFWKLKLRTQIAVFNLRSRGHNAWAMAPSPYKVICNVAKFSPENSLIVSPIAMPACGGHPESKAYTKKKLLYDLISNMFRVSQRRSLRLFSLKIFQQGLKRVAS